MSNPVDHLASLTHHEPARLLERARVLVAQNARRTAALEDLAEVTEQLLAQLRGRAAASGAVRQALERAKVALAA